MVNGLPTAGPRSASDAALASLHDQVRRSEFEQRQEEARCVREVWEERFSHRVNNVLAARFHPNTFKKLQLDQGVVDTNNVLKDMVAKVAVGWSDGADYKKEGANGEQLEGPAAEAFAAELAVMDLDCLARQLEQDWFLYRRTFTMPVVVMDDRIGQRVFEWRVYTPEKFDLILDTENATRWVGVVLYDTKQNRDGKACSTATVWTRTEWIVFEQDGDKWQWRSGGENPYRCIPGELGGAKDSAFALWGESEGLRLANLTIDVNAWETYERLLAAGYLKTLALESAQGETFPSGQYLRHGGVLQLGSGAQSPQVLDFSSDLAAFKDAQIHGPRAAAAVSLGLAADEFRQGSPAESGAALQMRYWARDRLAMQRRPRLARHIQALYRLGWWVLFVEMARPGMLPVYGLKTLSKFAPPFDGEGPAWAGRDLRFLVNPRDLRYPETQAEASARLKEDLELGLTSVVEEMMRRDPDLSKEAALERVKQNKALNKELSNQAVVRLDAIVGARRGSPVQAPPTVAKDAEQKPGDPGEPETEGEMDTEEEGPET